MTVGGQVMEHFMYYKKHIPEDGVDRIGAGGFVSL